MTQNPKRFDANMIVIGAGSVGLVSAYIAAALKAKVQVSSGGFAAAGDSNADTEFRAT